MNLLRAVRGTCAAVAARSRHVSIDPRRLHEFAHELASAQSQPAVYDPAHHHRGDAHSTLAFVLTLDAINFGSGWFPQLEKLPGLSGYLTIATRLKQHFDREGPFDTASLRALDAAAVARLLGQSSANTELGELMALFARAWSDLADFLDTGYGGRFEGPVEAAGGRAAQLVAKLARMPLYADVARYGALEVFFLKRAQITVADLALAFEGRDWGRFEDIDDLTIFADNLVPHVLRMAGVLAYAPELASKIESGRLLAAGCEEEVEIRACAVHAVECVAEVIAEVGPAIPVRQLDGWLWSRGQARDMKSRPRHRARTSFY